MTHAVLHFGKSGTIFGIAFEQDSRGHIGLAPKIKKDRPLESRKKIGTAKDSWKILSLCIFVHDHFPILKNWKKRSSHVWKKVMYKNAKTKKLPRNFFLVFLVIISVYIYFLMHNNNNNNNNNNNLCKTAYTQYVIHAYICT